MSRQFGIWSSERGLVSATKTKLTLSYLLDVRPGLPCGQLSSAPALSWPVALPEHPVQLDWSPTLATCSASQLQVARPHLHLSLSLVFQSLRMAGTHREAPVLRQAPQKLGDVLYPPTEPHTTGMLEVSKVHTIYWEVSGNPTGTPVMVLHGGPGGGSQAEYRQYFDPAVYRVVQVTNWTMKKQTSCIVYLVNRWTNVVVAGPPPMLSWRTTTPR